MFVMTIGFFLVGHFELNKMDWFHTKGHYIGLAGILSGSFGLGFVTKWSSSFSIVLIVALFVVCAAWVGCILTVKKTSDDIAAVTRRSKLCIGIELGMLQILSIILMFIVYGSGTNEGNIWASPFLPQ